MNQCVPNWDVDDPPPNQRQHLPLHHHPSAIPILPMFDSELAELTGENGHLAMNGFRHPGIANPIPKPTSSAAAAIPTIWEKPGPTGMLESIIDQATRSQLPEPISRLGLPLRHEPRNPTTTPASAADALVPCSDHDYQADWVPNPSSGPNCASQGSSAPTSGRNESNAVTLDTSGDDVGFTTTSTSPDFGFTTTSASPSPGEGGGSPETENTSFGGAHCRRSQREEEKVSKGAMGRSSISTKRSRASAVHNQYERKRRDRINQRMKTLQKLVPNSSKTDKASMLDEVIEYLKQLEAQVQMMNTMRNIPHMMMPMAMPQLQMSMLAQMTQMAQMGMVMGMMDTNTLGLHGHAGMPTVHHPSAFLPHLVRRSWNVPNAQMKQPCNGATLPNPFSCFFACPPQQHMGMDPFSRVAALYRQFYQQAPPSNPKT